MLLMLQFSDVALCRRQRENSRFDVEAATRNAAKFVDSCKLLVNLISIDKEIIYVSKGICARNAINIAHNFEQRRKFTPQQRTLPRPFHGLGLHGVDVRVAQS